MALMVTSNPKSVSPFWKFYKATCIGYAHGNEDGGGMNLTEKLIDLTELGYTPDFLVRLGIRKLLSKRLSNEDRGDCQLNQARLETLLNQFSVGPVAPVPEKANEQHYEVPASVFEKMLGRHFKYSCCLWGPRVNSLDQAEEDALQETCVRADLQDGMDILELGCGWGSLSLWMAEKYPNAQITSVSNSTSQREFIERRAEERAIVNLQVITRDMNDFDAEGEFDRVVSVEMFEHMRNYRELMRRISDWLKPDGKLFIHIFCHRSLTYEFVDQGASDWMSRYFFSGGVMPGDDLLLRFQENLSLQAQWRWSGVHYEKTSNAWVANMDRYRDEIMPALEETYGEAQATRWFYRWRMFYLACAELFGYNGGQEWWVSHYLFQNQQKRKGLQPDVASPLDKVSG